jgi:tetratricopeptide (TPR) repeat protein
MKKVLAALVLLLHIGVFSSVAQQVESYLVDAVSLYSNGEYKQAKDRLETLSAIAPQDDAVWYYLALSEAGLQDFSAARKHLEQAIGLDKGNYWYRQTLARLYLTQGETQLGIEMYEDLVKDFPDKDGLSYELLNLYLRQGQLEKALSALEDIETQRGPSEAVTQTRYEVYRQLNRPEEAVAALEAFNRDYSSPSILSMLGDYYLGEYQDSLAQVHYAEALSLDGSYIPAILGLSEVYRHQRKYPDYFRTLEGFFQSEDVPAETKAMYIGNLTRSLDPKLLQLHQSEYDEVVQDLAALHPQDSTVLSTVAGYYYSTGRVKESGKWFREVADQYPESLSHTVTYLQFLGMQENWEELRDRSLRAFDRFQELGFLDFANQANYQMGDFDAIIGNCQYILTNYPKDKDLCKSALAMKGDAYHSKGDSKQAFKAYDQALKIDPSYAPVLNNYAYYLCLTGKNLKKAYTMSKKTVEAEPDNATYLDTFAWILHLQGKDLEAKPFFKHAMLYGGKDSAVMLDHYAEVLYALGEYDLARSYWNQAKNKNTAGEVPDLEERVKARLAAIGK